MKKRETGQAYVDGLVLDYNYFRPHMGLDDKTPASVARAEVPFASCEDIATLAGSGRSDPKPLLLNRLHLTRRQTPQNLGLAAYAMRLEAMAEKGVVTQVRRTSQCHSS